MWHMQVYTDDVRRSCTDAYYLVALPACSARCCLLLQMSEQCFGWAHGCTVQKWLNRKCFGLGQTLLVPVNHGMRGGDATFWQTTLDTLVIIVSVIIIISSA